MIASVCVLYFCSILCFVKTHLCVCVCENHKQHLFFLPNRNEGIARTIFFCPMQSPSSSASDFLYILEFPKPGYLCSSARKLQTKKWWKKSEKNFISFESPVTTFSETQSSENSHLSKSQKEHRDKLISEQYQRELSKTWIFYEETKIKLIKRHSHEMVGAIKGNWKCYPLSMTSFIGTL